MFQVRWTRLAICLALLAAVLALAGCGKKQADEKLAERMTEEALEQATGQKADVDVHGGDITIKTADGEVKMVETSQWPADMFDVVPRFSHGKVQRVTSGTEGGMKKFNIWFVEVPDDASDKYLEQLKAAGFESQMATMGPQGGMLSAQKGSVAVQFMHGKEDKSGVLIAYEITE
jgi:hypothetical protein